MISQPMNIMAAGGDDAVNQLAAAVSDPLAMTLGWPVVLAFVLVARLQGGGLFTITVGVLAAFAILDSKGLFTRELFDPLVLHYGPMAALLIVVLSGIHALIGAAVGDNLAANIITGIAVMTAKATAITLSLPFKIIGFFFRGGKK